MGRPRTFDQSDTLEAIRSQFWETGYAGTSVDDLMTCTGLGKGSLYGAFGSKHEMFVKALQDYTEMSASELSAALAGDEAGAARRLAARIRGSAKQCNSKLGCMTAKAIAELAGRDDEVDAIIGDFMQRMVETVVTCVRQAQRAGDVRRDIEAKKIALMIVAVLRGLESMGKAGAAPAALRSTAEGLLETLKPVASGVA